jgi:hypothetical protein
VKKVSIAVDRKAFKRSEFQETQKRRPTGKAVNTRQTMNEPRTNNFSTGPFVHSKPPKIFMENDLGTHDSEPSTFNAVR